jgi:hypothetical protein
MSDDRKIALELKDGVFKYVPVQKSEVISTLCVHRLPYPYAESDIDILENVRTDIVRSISTKKLEVSSKLERINSLNAFIPPVPKGTEISLDNVIDKETPLKTKIDDIRSELSKIEMSLSHMGTTLSFVRLTIPLQNQIERINDIVRELLNLFDSPKSIFEYIYQPGLPEFNKNGEIPIQVFQYTENRYLIRLGIADLTSSEYVVRDMYDYLQINENNRIQVIDLLLFVISSIGVLIGSFSSVCQFSNGICRNREQKVAVNELVEKRRKKAIRNRNRVVSSLARPRAPNRPITVRRPIPAPRIHAVQATQATEVSETSFTKPSSSRSLPSSPMQEVKEILQIIHSPRPEKEEKRGLPVFHPIVEKRKKPPMTVERNMNVPLWLETTSESE